MQTSGTTGPLGGLDRWAEGRGAIRLAAVVVTLALAGVLVVVGLAVTEVALWGHGQQASAR